jgi:hypothetical protein
MSNYHYHEHLVQLPCDCAAKFHVVRHSNQYLARRLAEEAVRNCEQMRHWLHTRSAQYREDTAATKA